MSSPNAELYSPHVLPVRGIASNITRIRPVGITCLYNKKHSSGFSFLSFRLALVLILGVLGLVPLICKASFSQPRSFLSQTDDREVQK
jgi:hypothetical protein